mmetsp:Transcript_28636/g.68306  ORF Transcript_28636/g.68306 Transcript_28636/m.68306 type:complete len:116 (+) Transcript_28636:96-443(+)
MRKPPGAAERALRPQPPEPPRCSHFHNRCRPRVGCAKKGGPGKGLPGNAALSALSHVYNDTPGWSPGAGSPLPAAAGSQARIPVGLRETSLTSTCGGAARHQTTAAAMSEAARVS